MRIWRGWHHHMTLVILAHFLSGSDAAQIKKKRRGLTLPPVQVLLLGALPKREFDGQLVLDLVDCWQRRNAAAYVSHRKRRLTQHSQLGKVFGKVSLKY